MAGKFKIFIDDCQARLEPEEKPAIHHHNHQQPPTTQYQQVSQLHQQQANALKQAVTTSNPDLVNNHAKRGESNINEQEKFIALHQVTTSVHPLQLNAATYQPLQPTQQQQQPPLKREPLGLRQQLCQVVTSTETSSAPSSQTATSSSSALSVDEEDQENDISMASLGSDFIPSIIHADDEFEDDQSFEVEEEEDYEVDTSSGGLLVEQSCGDSFDEDDLENDELLRLELKEAFKQHDESQLFKSAVYINDIQDYLLKLERNEELRPLPNYMDYQSDLDSDKRAILINWLVEVSDEYDLQTETLFICTGIIDRFLSKMSIPTSKFQLLGVAAMFIASKYEEIYPPNLYQFVELTDDTYSGRQVRQMEQEILKTLEFRIPTPTVSFFLTQIFAFNKFSKSVYHMAEYLCYLSLIAGQPFLDYYPSEIALAAVILAANQLDMSANISHDLKLAYNQSLLEQSKRNLPNCQDSLRLLQQQVSEECPIVRKYSDDSHSRVALVK